jgi:hypothetical protein
MMRLRPIGYRRLMFSHEHSTAASQYCPAETLRTLRRVVNESSREVFPPDSLAATSD